MDLKTPKLERMESTVVDQEERLEIVDLSGMSLESFASNSLNLGIICKLDLSNNNLQTIPESLTTRLLNIIVLDVHSNQLQYLPNSIGCLSKLKVLQVSGNLLQSFPASIENCRSLEEIKANFNKLVRLPEKMGLKLKKVKKVQVKCNKVISLPPSLSRLVSLKVLDVSLNCLHSLPNDLENLSKLEVLNVSLNFHHLAQLPYSIGLLISLIHLDISYNRITILPNSLGCLTKLQRLSLEGNPLTSPPLELVDQGLHAVKDYLLSGRMMKGSASVLVMQKQRQSWVHKLLRRGRTTLSRPHHDRCSLIF